MDIASEGRLWRAAGILAALVAVGFFAWCQYLFYDSADMTRWPLRLGIGGAFCLLTAISFLVTARILGALTDEPEGRRAASWKVFSYGSVPLGLVVVAVEVLRVQFQAHRITSNHKAVFAAGAFILMAGIIGLIGERCVAHITNSGNRSQARSQGA